MSRQIYNLNKHKDIIINALKAGHRITNLPEFLLSNYGITSTYDAIKYFLDKNGIDYKNYIKNPKTPSIKDLEKLSKCCLCGQHVIDVEKHSTNCRVGKNVKMLEDYKDDIVRYLEDGYSITAIPKLIGVDISRTYIKTFCNVNSIVINKVSKFNTPNGNTLAKDSVAYNKRNQTVKDRYGVNNVFQLESVKKKSNQTKIQKYGTQYPRNIVRISKPHRYISNLLNIMGVVHLNEHHIIKNLEEQYKPIPDIFIPDLDLVIEVYGDFWHGNPLFYNADSVFHTFRGKKTAEEIWEHDKNRIDILRRNGYDVEVIWEHEISEGNINEGFLNGILSNYKNRRSVS